MPNNDYILRRDALKATCENCTEHYVCNGKCDDTDRLREIPAADVEPKQKWIPVTKRKPEPVTAKNRRKTEPVLLYSPKGGYYIGWYYGVDSHGNDKYLNRTSRDSRQYITTKVTQWMSLSKPPEE